VQAGRLPNPRFDLRRAGAADIYDIEETLSFQKCARAADHMPYAHDIETRRFANTQNFECSAVSRSWPGQPARPSTRDRRAPVPHYLQHMSVTAAETRRRAAHRMVSAGNWNRWTKPANRVSTADACKT